MNRRTVLGKQNIHVVSVRRLAHEAAAAGLLSPELAAGISRVKGVKQLGFRSGNWLSAEQSSEVLRRACGDTMRAKRDYAMLAMLFGCGFRRSELVGLELDDIRMRQGHGAVVDLIGKGGHIRTVPIPTWVKAAPVYHGFVVLEDVNVEGFTFGAITDFEAEPCEAGDAFIVAPDGSRAGLVWEISATTHIEEVRPFEPSRWGVWAVSFPYPMDNRANARKNLAVVLPQLRARWEEWKHWRSRRELDQLS